MENIERNRTVKYELYNKAFGLLELNQVPKGYSNDNLSIERDKKSRDITTKTLIKLEFFGVGSEFLTNTFNSFGVSERTILTKYEKDPKSLSENWEFKYSQYLDFNKYAKVSKNNSVTIEAKEGTLHSDIDNRKSDKYDLLNNESADGVNIGDLKTYNFVPQVRGVYNQSLFRDEQSNYRVNSIRDKSFSAVTRRSIPLKEITNFDKDDSIAPWSSEEIYNDKIPHSPIDAFDPLNSDLFAGDAVFYRAEIKKTIRVKMDLEFTVSDVINSRTSDGLFGVDFLRSSVNNFADKVTVLTRLLEVSDPRGKIGTSYSVSYDEVLTLDVGESISFGLWTAVSLFGSILTSNAFMDVYFSVTKSQVTIRDFTEYEVSEGKCIKPFDLFDRIVAKITGETGMFRSDIFGVGGKYEHIVVDNGFFARGFPFVEIDADGNEKRIQFKTSFKEAFESFNYLEPLAYIVEIEGNKEVIRIEDAKYTMKNFIGVSLLNADNITEKSSPPDFFSRIVIGHDKSLEYDDANGIEEPNGKSELNTHIKDSKSEYSIISKYRPDSIGYELTRRKYYKNFPKEDTKRDSHIWMHDAKFLPASGSYTHNLWADRFDSPPTGIYDPETSWNLWLTPMNRLFYGHGYSVKRGLYHFRNAKIRFDSSNANQNLKTIIGGVELHEGGNISISDIPKPKVEPMKINLSFKMTTDIKNRFSGFTKINGKFTPNYFGLIEYLEKGELKYGRLIKLDAEKEGDLTMIKARL